MTRLPTWDGQRLSQRLKNACASPRGDTLSVGRLWLRTTLRPEPPAIYGEEVFLGSGAVRKRANPMAAPSQPFVV